MTYQQWHYLRILLILISGPSMVILVFHPASWIRITLALVWGAGVMAWWVWLKVTGRLDGKGKTDE